MSIQSPLIEPSQTKDNLNQYVHDPDVFPPDIHKAIQHGSASKIGMLYPPDVNVPTSKCICCGFELDTEQLPVSGPISQFNQYGLGFPLFFQFLKSCCLFMIFGTIFFQLASMINQSYGSSCIDSDNQTYMLLMANCTTKDPTLILDEDQQQQLTSICRFNYGEDQSDENCQEQFCNYKNQICILTQLNKFYFINIQFDLNSRIAQATFSTLFVVIFILFLQYLRTESRKFEEVLDENSLDPNDFTVMIRHLPDNGYTSQELEQCLSNWWMQQRIPIQMQISKIYIAFNFYEFNQIREEKNKLTLQKKKIIGYQQKNDSKFPSNWNQHKHDKLEAKIQDIQEKLIKLQLTVQNENAHPSEVAFVSFETTDMLKYLIDQSATNSLQRCFLPMTEYLGLSNRRVILKGKALFIERAPEPTDIQWENCGYTNAQKLKRRILSHIGVFIVMTGVFALQVELQVLVSHMLSTLEGEVNTIRQQFMVSTCFSMVIVGINGVLSVIIREFVILERYSSQTEFNIEMTIFLSRVQFFNTAILTLVANCLVCYYINSNAFIQVAFQKEGGIATQVFSISYVYALSTAAELIFNPAFYLRLFMRWYIKRESNSKNSLMTQSEANGWFEGFPILLYTKYSYCILGMWYTALYGPLVPELFFFSLVGFTIVYWVEKYCFCYRYGRPPQLGPSLNEKCIDLLDYFPLIFALSQFGLDMVYSIDQGASILALDCIGLGFSIAALILPMDRINQCLFPIEELPSLSLTFTQAQLKFDTNYDLTNPLTKDVALANQLIAQQSINKQNQLSSMNQNYYKQNNQVDYRTAEQVSNDPYYNQGKQVEMQANKL